MVFILIFGLNSITECKYTKFIAIHHQKMNVFLYVCTQNEHFL